jgi:outer membrane protein
VNTSLLRAPLLALGFGVLAFGQAGAPPTKVGIIDIQRAIIQTKDGQKAAADLNTKVEPKRKEVDAKQAELKQMEQQYRTGANTMSDEAKQKLMRDIDQHRKQLQRQTDDAQAELEAEQQRILQDLGQKVMAVVTRYANEHGFALVLDVSNAANTPVLYASSSIDITADIVALYDKQPAAPAPAASAPAAAKPPAAAPKPAAPPAK